MTAATTTPEQLVARVAARYDDDEGVLTTGTLRRLAERQAGSAKVCAICARSLRLSAFGVLSRAKDGLDTRCRECLARATRERRAAAKAVAA